MFNHYCVYDNSMKDTHVHAFLGECVLHVRWTMGQEFTYPLFGVFRFWLWNKKHFFFFFTIDFNTVVPIV